MVGAENSHSWGFAEICNCHHQVDVRVTHLWGEDASCLRESASRGCIPCSVDDWREMLGQVDGVMVDHRDGSHHAEVARFFLERGIPVFLDKPATCSTEELRELLRLERFHGGALAAFGILSAQRSFRQFAAKFRDPSEILFLNGCGPADIDSPYGGIFFYGFHQVDCVVEMMGTEIREVQLVRNGRHGLANLFFAGGQQACLHLIRSEWNTFHLQVGGSGGVYSTELVMDESPYLEPMRILETFLRQKKSPQSPERIFAPIAILEALQRSLSSGKPEAVSRL